MASVFDPGEIRLVASPHYMKPEIPQEIAAAVRVSSAHRLRRRPRSRPRPPPPTERSRRCSVWGLACRTLTPELPSVPPLQTRRTLPDAAREVDVHDRSPRGRAPDLANPAAMNVEVEPTCISSGIALVSSSGRPPAQPRRRCGRTRRGDREGSADPAPTEAGPHEQARHARTDVSLRSSERPSHGTFIARTSPQYAGRGSTAHQPLALHRGRPRVHWTHRSHGRPQRVCCRSR